MNVYQQFRVWSRRAPTSERVGTALASVLALTAFAWLLVPVIPSEDDAEVSASGGATFSTGGDRGATAPGGEASTGAPATPVQTVDGGGEAASAGEASSAPNEPGSQGPGGCVSPPKSDQGVSDKEIRIAVTLVDLGGPGNATFGVPPPDEARKYWQVPIDDLNAHGGVACRKLVATYYAVNPVDQNDLRDKCLAIVEARPFAVIDSGTYTAYPALADCYRQNRLPLFVATASSKKQFDSAYPYLFGGQSFDVLYKNTVFGLAQQGFFDPAKGFKKLGWVYRDCYPELIPLVEGWLREAGVAGDRLTKYNFGCPSSIVSPSDDQQAVLKFKIEDVTHVIPMGMGADVGVFTGFAQQQSFRPKYGFPDEGVVATSYGAGHADYDNIAEALAITASRYGEERTPGSQPTPDTARCNSLFVPRGFKPVYEQPVAFGGVTCDFVWMLAAAVRHAPTLERVSLAPGLQAAKTVGFSYPYGPNDFNGARTAYGGQFWRPLRFVPSCSCWQVIDPNFGRSF